MTECVWLPICFVFCFSDCVICTESFSLKVQPSRLLMLIRLALKHAEQTSNQTLKCPETTPLKSSCVPVALKCLFGSVLEQWFISCVISSSCHPVPLATVAQMNTQGGAEPWHWSGRKACLIQSISHRTIKVPQFNLKLIMADNCNHLYCKTGRKQLFNEVWQLQRKKKTSFGDKTGLLQRVHLAV